MKKVLTPTSTLIETIAGQLAATWYEVGRGQGLTSKHKTARAYAAANLEKFIPKAVELCLEMLGPNSTSTPEMKEEIWEALQERLNDPELLLYRPNVDVKKVIEQLEIMERKKGPVIIDTNSKNWCQTHNREAFRCETEGGITIPCVLVEKPKTVLHNPFKAKRH